MYEFCCVVGLINEKDIDEAHRHVQKFLLDNKLVDPVTMEIMEEPAVPQGSGSVKKFKSGFIASLDGQTFIQEKERFSNGETVDICDHHVCINNNDVLLCIFLADYFVELTTLSYHRREFQFI